MFGLHRGSIGKKQQTVAARDHDVGTGVEVLDRRVAGPAG